MSETLSLGCVDDSGRVLYAVGVLCTLGVFSPLLQFPVSSRHTHTASGFRGRTLLAVDQLNANSIQVNEGSAVHLLMAFGFVKFRTVFICIHSLLKLSCLSGEAVRIVMTCFVLQPFTTKEIIGFTIGSVSSLLYLCSRLPQILTNVSRVGTMKRHLKIHK